VSIPIGAGLRVNDGRTRVDNAAVPVDSAYQFKAFIADAPGSFSITSPTGVTSLFDDAASYSQPTLPGWQ
jgi:hypothetical protein